MFDSCSCCLCIIFESMIPFQKIFTLVIRTFSKPVLGLMKKKQQEGKLKAFRWFFVGLGRRYHHFEHWLNHRLLKTSHKKQITELKQEILLQKGVEAFYQLFFYCIVIGLPMWQLYKSAESAEKKELKLKNKIDSMEGKLDQANKSLAVMIEHITQSKLYAQELKKDRESKLQESIRSRQTLRFKTIYEESNLVSSQLTPESAQIETPFPQKNQNQSTSPQKDFKQ